ncbi:MAG: FtsX-like permease family protein [Streptosporangiales bacterium]|nr:FtsX-like permease family protein [Streptosporangiales bacterium]
MTFALAWLRLEARRHRRELVVLAVLVAVATATVLASFAGARRGATALDRLLAETLPCDTVVLPNDPRFDWDAVRALPEVEAISTFLEADVPLGGVPPGSGAVRFVPADADVMRTVERPVVVAGRLADPSRVDEAVVTSGFVERAGLGVGDTVTYRLRTPEQTDALLAGDPIRRPGGPRVEARIVGVVRSLWYSDTRDAAGTLVPSPELFARYEDNLTGTRRGADLVALVRLEGGAADVPRFRADLTALSDRTDIEVWNAAEWGPADQKRFGFDAAAMLVFGLIALAAALVLIGQSVVRHTAPAVAELFVLRAVGADRRLVVLAASLAPVLAVAAGATAGVAVAVAASHWMPLGAAGLLEPDPGVDVDLLVLGGGWVAAAVLAFAGAAASALLASARPRGQARSRSTVAAATVRAGLPVSVTVGSRFALEPGRGDASVPTRPALLAAVAGVAGIVAVATLSAGVADAAGNPARFGQTYQLETWLGGGGTDAVPSAEVRGLVARDRDVTGVNDSRVGVAEAGRRSVRLYTYDPVVSPLEVVLTSGRLASGAGEVVLAPHTAGELDATVGSTVALTGERGTRRLTVTGLGFVPSTPRNFYFDGGWLTVAGYATLFRGFESHLLHIAVRPGADPAQVMSRLDRATAAAAGGLAVPFSPSLPPAEVSQIRGVRVLPFVLAGFLALLAVGAVGHALAVAVRRRRRDVAVLRALGMTHGQCRAVVATQATVLALVGLVFGVPLGMMLGRTVWRFVTDYMPLAYQPPLAFWALLLVGPVALFVANLLAAGPARRAIRLRVGDVLRAE